MWGWRYLLALVAVVASLAIAPANAQGVDGGWPREITQDGNVLRYYQPQIDSWEKQKILKMRIAVVLSGPAFKQPLAGALWLHANTDTDLETRTVHLTDLSTDRVLFSVTDRALADQAEQALRKMIPPGPIVVALDRILAGMKAAQTLTPELPLKNDAPMIIVSQTPARLVVFDGQPVFAPIGNAGLQYALNTNWTFINVMATAEYYLLDDKTWLTSNDIAGPWTIAKRLPPAMTRLPDDDNWRDVRAAAATPQPQYQKPPRIHVVTEPAEMIVINGPPKLVPVGKEGGPLSYVNNTDADLFFHRPDNSWYYLAAGRWYRATSLEGPWTYATRDLPKTFADIPEKSAKARALYSVPGTPQAEQAVLVASIPQTAVVSRSQTRLDVTYSGPPQFAAIQGSALFYAVNASTTVIKVAEDSYYACERGVWFTAPSPTGPWVVATSVPPSIYQIPPSAPVYNVTYVTQEATSDDSVTSSFTSGYLGGFVTAGLLMWGTGYYYPPYWHYGPVPGYFPRPYTWGACAWYNPATNTYFRGGAAYGPYGGFGAGAAYSASTGTYARGFGAYGPNGGFKVGTAYNPATGAWARGAAGYGPNGAWRGGYGYSPSTGISFAGAQGSNVYGSWGQAAVSRGDQWARAGYRSTAEGTVAGVRTAQGTGAIVGQGAAGNTVGIVRGQNNTYVGGDGNVYRKNDSGWQKYENGGWNAVTPPHNQRTPSQQRAQQPAAAPAPERLAGTPARQANRDAMATSEADRIDANARGPDRATLDNLDQERFNRQQGAQCAGNWQNEFQARGGYGGGRPFQGGGGFRGRR